MDVLNERTIDIGLMIIGYMTAAGLGMLIYASFSKRRREAPAAVATGEGVSVHTARSRSARARCSLSICAAPEKAPHPYRASQRRRGRLRSPTSAAIVRR